MAAGNTHIIAKHILHLVFPEKEGHFQRQDHISKVYWEKLARKMGELFDRYAGPDEVIRLDSLEIDLGRIEWKSFDDEFVKRALEQLELKLIQLLKVDIGQVAPASYRQDRFQQWLSFLEKGAFDWHVVIREEADFHRAVLDSLYMEAASMAQLSGLVKRSQRAFDRLILQHEDAFLKTLAEHYTGHKQDALPQVLAEFREVVNRIDPPSGQLVFARFRTRQSTRFHFWARVLTTAVLERRKDNWQQLAIGFLKILTREQDWPELISRIREELERQPAALPLLRKVVGSLPPSPFSKAEPKAEAEKRSLPGKEIPEEERKAGKRPPEEGPGFEKMERHEESGFVEEHPDVVKDTDDKTPGAEPGGQPESNTSLPKEAKEEPFSIDKLESSQKEDARSAGDADPSDESDETKPYRPEPTQEARPGEQEGRPGEREEHKQAYPESPVKKLPEEGRESSPPPPAIGELWEEAASEQPGQKAGEGDSGGQTTREPAAGKQESLLGEPVPNQDRSSPPAKERAPETREIGPKEGRREEASREKAGEKTREESVAKQTEEDTALGGAEKRDAIRQEKAMGKESEERPMPAPRRPPEQKRQESGRRYGALADLPVGASFYVFNAGVVLIHPFLAHFFRTLKLVQEEEFADDAAQHKAIHLIQYLATRQLGLPEYELLLPKFLCGIPFDIPIERDVEITPEEMEEGEGLLDAAVRHWGALGNASPDALREGFLRRAGKLEKRENGWYLKVEQKTIDILLGKLPWNLSILKLPWMPELLRVEWA